MESETSRSCDTGADYEGASVLDGNGDYSEEECGLADAFKQFEAQAEKRTLELLKFTDEQLFNQSHDPISGAKENATQEPTYPAHVYTSDQFRLKQPPTFQHWHQKFQYLQVTGSKMRIDESIDPIPLVSIEPKGPEPVIDDLNTVELQAKGVACLQEPTGTNVVGGSDGVINDTLQHDEKPEIEEPESTKCALHAAYAEAVLDNLTVEWFSSTVAPRIKSLYTSLVEKQGHHWPMRQSPDGTIEERIVFETARQYRRKEKVHEDAEDVRQLQLHGQEERKRRKQRQQVATKEKAVTIATPATSMRKEGTCKLRRSDRWRTRPVNIQCLRPRPDWVTGGALTNDKLCDIPWKKSTRPSVHPPRFPASSRQRYKTTKGLSDSVPNPDKAFAAQKQNAN